MGCKKQAKAKVQVVGANHYKRFCQCAGLKVLAPPLKERRDLVKLRMYAAPQTYVTPDGKTKKGIKTSNIKTYLSHIDRWYSDLTQESKGWGRYQNTLTRVVKPAPGGETSPGWF